MQFIIFKSFLPEIFLSLMILLQLLYNTFIINNYKNRFPIVSKEMLLQTIFLLFSVLILLLNNKCEVYCFNFLFLNDLSAIKLKSLIVLLSLTLLLILFQNFEIQKLNFFEFFILYLLALLSLLLLVSVTDMLTTYLVVEMQALCFYILACFTRNSAFSTEAGLKYFIASSFISIVFLLSCSIIYSIVGTLNFSYLNLLFYCAFLINNKILLTATILFIITLLFKLVIAPFHFWAPDVYEGAPLGTTIIFSILPKLSLFFLFIKWLLVTNNNVAFQQNLGVFLAFFGLVSISIGLGFALQQKRLKRLMIYSSISQLGFLIATLANISYDNLVSVFFFLIIYLITSLFFWITFSNFYNFQQKIRLFYNKEMSTIFITSLANLNQIHKSWSFSFLIVFFSIAGLPPFVGFYSKIFVISSLISSNHLFLASFVLLISLMSAFYYLRFLKIIFFEPTDNSLNNDTSQIIFSNSYFNNNCFLNSFLLFLLVYLFYHPTLLFLYCHTLVLNIFFF